MKQSVREMICRGLEAVLEGKFDPELQIQHAAAVRFSGCCSMPLDEHIFAGTAKATGRRRIKFLCARDAQILNEDYHCLIIRSSYQALLEVQADLFKYLSQVFPGTKYNSQESIFQLGGKLAPYGTIELAYSAQSPLEQARALTRLQGRSKSTIIVDEAGATASILDFTDELMGVSERPSVPRRLIMLGNPGDYSSA